MCWLLIRQPTSFSAGSKGKAGSQLCLFWAERSNANCQAWPLDQCQGIIRETAMPLLVSRLLVYSCFSQAALSLTRAHLQTALLLLSQTSLTSTLAAPCQTIL